MSSANIQEKEAKKIRQRKGVVRPTKAPLGSISFVKYIYILAAVTLAFAVYYAYRMSEIQRTKAINYQDTLKKARGKEPKLSEEQIAKGARDHLQQKIEDLAGLLGVQPIALASAIAGVVKPSMPAASASSISKQEAKTNDPILSAFSEGMEATNSVTAPPEAKATDAEGGVAASVFSAINNLGFDDMDMGMD